MREVATVTNTTKEGNLTIADYVDFLDSPTLVSGAILVSTASCEVTGMMLAVNASIRVTSGMSGLS